MAKKPELLMPAGNIRAFYAALEGGADAVYLGLQDFNARKRANNFTLEQVPVLTDIAEKHEAKIYITLNTVIKNKELADLYSLLYQLAQTKIQAIIIQDWGTYYLMKKYFPNLSVHASTQMAFHNSAGALFGEKAGIDRIIMARELTLKELQQIKSKSQIELELFVHGALCYSFSGLCLFSSHSGGMSANRGSCKQSCRWMYKAKDNKKYIFSLKDIELIDYVPDMMQIGINSLKIEGRMKSFDYVYTIARAYRMVLDDPSRLNEAKELLKEDIGRDKTTYFMGGNISDTYTDKPNTGLYTGKITRIEGKTLFFTSEIDPKTIKRIRICSPNSARQEDMTLENILIRDKEISALYENASIKKGDMVYVIGYSTRSFASRLPTLKTGAPKRPFQKESVEKTNQILQSIKPNKTTVWIRVNSPKWLDILSFNEVEYYILNFSVQEWTELLDGNKLDPFISRLICGFPKFISEQMLPEQEKLIQRIHQKGIRNFLLSHVSQTKLLPSQSRFFADENIYTFNDAAIEQLRLFGFSGHVFPLENDFQNLFQGRDRNGIVPLYFYPQLFFSRMPVKSEFKNTVIKDDNNLSYQIITHHGATITLPKNPVSIMHSKADLIKNGFRNFLIDFSFVEPTNDTLVKILDSYVQSRNLQPSSNFNFKKGLI